MRTIRRHLLAAALLLLAAQGTGFFVLGGRCTCQSASGTSCCCCKGGKMEGMDCPMCKRAKHDDNRTTCRCTARCGGHDAALPWLVEIDAVLPGEATVQRLPALAAALPAPTETVLDAVRKPPSPPPKASLS